LASNESIVDMKDLILVIDIGNTSVSVGLLAGQRVLKTARLEQKDSTTRSIVLLLKRLLVDNQQIAGAAIASVVPRVNGVWAKAVESVAGCWPLFVGHSLNLGVEVDYPHPETIGADRLANASAGAARYGAPLIVADFGTAVTFDVVTSKRGYVGGIIAPGLPLMFDYLAERTALLPHIALSATRGRYGRSTAEAMQLGALWGYRGMVRGIVEELRRSREMRNAKLVCTGGYAPIIVRGFRPVMLVDPHLTLRGIGRILQLNADGGES
jgi:type III pantothenate kinase